MSDTVHSFLMSRKIYSSSRRVSITAWCASYGLYCLNPTWNVCDFLVHIVLIVEIGSWLTFVDFYSRNFNWVITNNHVPGMCVGCIFDWFTISLPSQQSFVVAIQSSTCTGSPKLFSIINFIYQLVNKIFTLSLEVERIIDPELRSG